MLKYQKKEEVTYEGQKRGTGDRTTRRLRKTPDGIEKQKNEMMFKERRWEYSEKTRTEMDHSGHSGDTGPLDRYSFSAVPRRKIGMDNSVWCYRRKHMSSMRYPFWSMELRKKSGN